MARTPGSGRQRGTPNKFTGEFRHALKLAFENVGGVEALTNWGKSNPDAFFALCGRLIPGEMAAHAALAPQLRVVVDRGFKLRDQEARHHATPVTFENSAPPLLKGDGG